MHQPLIPQRLPERSNMFTSESLAEIHRRAHKSFETLVSHCRSLSEVELNREFIEFGYPSIRLQIHHIIGAELYWIEVLKGNIQADDDSPDYPTVDSLEKYRISTVNNTQEYLKNISPHDLNTPNRRETWGGTAHNFVPGNVIIRPIVHFFQHAGQISVMFKFLKKPVLSLDYPIL